MTESHLRLVDPPDVDDGDDGDDGGDDGVVSMSVSIGGGGRGVDAAVVISDDASPEEIAYHLVMALRGAATTYDQDVALALERRLLHWGDLGER